MLRYITLFLSRHYTGEEGQLCGNNDSDTPLQVPLHNFKWVFLSEYSYALQTLLERIERI